MICKNCSAALPDNSVFCPHCGQSVTETTDTASASAPAFRRAGSLDGIESAPDVFSEKEHPGAPASPQPKASSIFYRAQLNDFPGAAVKNASASDATSEPTPSPMPAASEPAGARYCPSCGCPLFANAMFCSKCGKELIASSNKWRKKSGGLKFSRKPKGRTLAVCGALLLAIVLAVSFVLNWFGASGPASRIISAARNTAEAESYTMEFAITMQEYSQERSGIYGSLRVAADPDNRQLTLYGNLTVDNDYTSFAIYHGYFILAYGSDNYAYADIQEEIDAYFDSCEKDFSLESLINTAYDEGSYDELKEDLEEHIDLEMLDKCLSDYMQCLNSTKWLEENAGYTLEKNNGVTTYRFTPDAYRFLRESADILESAFVSRDIRYEINTGLSELQALSDYIDLELTFDVKKDALVHIGADVSGEYARMTCGTVLHAEIDYYDIGETGFDTYQLDSILSEAKSQGYYIGGWAN